MYSELHSMQANVGFGCQALYDSNATKTRTTMWFFGSGPGTSYTL